MGILISAFKIIFLLGFLIFIHEGGHFLAAKFFKVKVEYFSIGFGPKIWKKKGKETEYSLSLIPFGGYVKLTGEDEAVDVQGSFSNCKIWQRIIIVAAGAIVNIIFAIIVYFILMFVATQYVSTTVDKIIPEYADKISQIEVGDKILEVNNHKIRIRSDIAKALRKDRKEKAEILVERNGKEILVEVTPTEYSKYNYVLGAQMAVIDASLKDKFYYSFWETTNFVTSIGESLKLLVTGNIGMDQMTGPVGISEMVVKTSGLYDFIYLLSLISLSLGVTNLLPIPALDGGKIVLLIIEKIRGKSLRFETEAGIQTIGFLFLIILSLYVTYNDILRIF